MPCYLAFVEVGLPAPLAQVEKLFESSSLAYHYSTSSGLTQEKAVFSVLNV